MTIKIHAQPVKCQKSMDIFITLDTLCTLLIYILYTWYTRYSQYIKKVAYLQKLKNKNVWHTLYIILLNCHTTLESK